MALAFLLPRSPLPDKALTAAGGEAAGTVVDWRSCPAALRAALAFNRLLPWPVLLIGLYQIKQLMCMGDCDMDCATVGANSQLTAEHSLYPLHQLALPGKATHGMSTLPM